MTVRELIEQLQECHPDDQVVVQLPEPEPNVSSGRADPDVAVGAGPGGVPIVLIKPRGALVSAPRKEAR